MNYQRTAWLAFAVLTSWISTASRADCDYTIYVKNKLGVSMTIEKLKTSSAHGPEIWKTQHETPVEVKDGEKRKFNFKVDSGCEGSDTAEDHCVKVEIEGLDDYIFHNKATEKTVVINPR